MVLSPRQQDIAEAAIQLISERSIQELTIKNLSSRLGVTEAALYRHFRGKIDILTAILHLFSQQAEAVRVAAMERGGPPLDLIGHIILKHVEAFISRPPMADVVFSEEIFQNDSILSRTVHDIMKRNFEAMQKLISRGQKEGGIRRDIPPAELTTIVIGTLRMLVTRWRLARFGTDLKSDGNSTWKSLRTILSP